MNMSSNPALSDHAVHDRLHGALQALGREPGETTRGNTALEAARTMLRLMSLGLVKAMEDNADHVEGLIGPERSHRPPSG